MTKKRDPFLEIGNRTPNINQINRLSDFNSNTWT